MIKTTKLHAVLTNHNWNVRAEIHTTLKTVSVVISARNGDGANTKHFDTMDGALTYALTVTGLNPAV